MSRVVPFGKRREIPDPARVAEFAAMARRLARERNEAPALVDRALAEAGRTSVASLAERPELRSSGALDYLTTLVAEELQRDAAYAGALADLAAAIAHRLSASEYPRIVIRQLRAHALIDVARVRRTSGQPEAALEILGRAATILDGGLAHDSAMVGIELALTYRDLGRPAAEVRELLCECGRVLRDHGDFKTARRAVSLIREPQGSSST